MNYFIDRLLHTVYVLLYIGMKEVANEQCNDNKVVKSGGMAAAGKAPKQRRAACGCGV